MEEKLIESKTAKLAKEKGFPQNLFNTSWYNRFGSINGRTDINENGEYLYYGPGTYTSNPKKKISKEEYKEYTSIKYSAPTQSLIQLWLQKTHNIYTYIDWYDSSSIIWQKNINKVETYYHTDLEKLLQKALKLIPDVQYNPI
jgi:hypothetical protein